MKKSILTILAVFICMMSFAQKDLQFLTKNINKFNHVHASSYAAGYSLTYSYDYEIKDGVLKEVITYVKTQQKVLLSVDLKDLIKIEKVTEEGKHESLLLTFKDNSVDYINGNFQEKQNAISIQFCTKTTQNSSLKLKCEKAKHTLNTEFSVKTIQAFQGLIK